MFEGSSDFEWVFLYEKRISSKVWCPVMVLEYRFQYYVPFSKGSRDRRYKENSMSKFSREIITVAYGLSIADESGFVIVLRQGVCK